MLIDVIALALLILSIYKGFRKGLIVAVFSFVAFIVGLAAALKLSAAVAEYIGSNVNISQRWLPVIAFLVVFFVVVLLIRLGAKALEGVVQVAMLGWLNKLGGIIFYILIYFFIFSILLFYAQQLHLIKPQTTEISVSYPYIQPIGPKIMSVLGSVIPAFKDMFDQLLQFFQNVSDKNNPAQYSFLY
jgi:membrane protein required for colicin V production